MQRRLRLAGTEPLEQIAHHAGAIEQRALGPHLADMRAGIDTDSAYSPMVMRSPSRNGCLMPVATTVPLRRVPLVEPSSTR